MSVRLAVGLLLAALSTGALNWGFFVQHGAAASLPPLSLGRPLRSLRLLFSEARWLAGFLVGIGGWVLYVAALELAPLSLVQAVSAGGIGLLALLVSRVSGLRLSRREWMGVLAALAGLALLSVSLAGQPSRSISGSWLSVALWLGGSVALAGLAADPAARLLAGGAGLGAAAGILYAAGDVATKAAVSGGRMLLFIPPLLACHGLAFLALQLGFQRGGALATVGVSNLFANALPIAAGMTVFHEPLPSGALGVVRVAAFAAVVLGAALLAGRAGERAQTAAPARKHARHRSQPRVPELPLSDP